MPQKKGNVCKKLSELEFAFLGGGSLLEMLVLQKQR